MPHRLDTAESRAKVRFGARWPILAAGALLLGACQAQRSLRITSVPSGAQCRVDGEILGTTPVEMDFVHYGGRRVTLYLEGYLTDSRVVDLSPPWFGYFPFDIFSEVLFPIGWQDRHQVQVVMQPGLDTISEPDLQSVLDRAESLRRAGPEGPALESVPGAQKQSAPPAPAPGDKSGPKQ